MHSDWVFGAIVVAFFIVVFVLMGWGILAIDAWKCEARWTKAGYPSEFSLATGCMVKRKDGTWVPASSLRDLSI